ncbi:hypothetical protein N5C36_18810 [Shewanella xiamenensis]|uniref:hypothetical protein n=1 Tax=Shewanella xiamenensis TaxID=332186 RepID=UPI00244B8318|nr:hypothetical protein [Shewanella xiamenensis]MDH1316128.1 hypothetical protein [Shewanella xiamenensis]
MDNLAASNQVRVIIDDNVTPVLLSSALEAFDHVHKTPRGKGQTGLETYGLLWGYVIPPKTEAGESKIVVTTATIETSAVRHQDWVAPNWESIKDKKELIESYWPNLELVGTFHSHPYESLDEVMKYKGWQASEDDDGEGDRIHWPELHNELVDSQPLMAHLILTVTQLKKSGWALPSEIEGRDHNGLTFNLGNKKLWLNAYATTYIEEESDDGLEELICQMHPGPIKFDSPALSLRMIK